MVLERVRQKVGEKLEQAVEKIEDPVAMVLTYAILHSLTECNPQQICKQHVKNIARRLKQLIKDIRACTNYDDTDSIRECIEEILSELEQEVDEVLKQ